mmetsp:Transcript_23478/g.35647  ORF Transcript_23478/g.35647 Transcript_23478/m.35647 type:complete len:478 (+) Transcript_23478:131-1564(+)|eukprot:CAMPEP_0178904674 /NCGR_PEP_ID=MMETSP0786-20121207/5828_1 /TAXON_ID=186022 /ORGANISM="Thalassionema frauenfeldii, Strain CCMP 1798" /LENGTH=477 /DNA_ID=CAMNT_0020576151 /DNA_START=73 /DNA_END=1506 /DNA_ORIENTATION=-
MEIGQESNDLQEPLIGDETTLFQLRFSQDGHRTLSNFFIMAVLFSANHGTVVSCLSLATSRLGEVGAWQSGLLYVFYTISGVFGGSYIVKTLGGRNGMILGMILYLFYVGCFLAATLFPNLEQIIAFVGAAFGGIGAGFLWIAQGNYFTEAAKRHAADLAQDVSDSTSYLAGIFGFIYLAFEVLLRLSSSVLITFLDWRAIFALYTGIAFATTVGMTFVISYPKEEDATSVLNQATATIQLLIKDSKMKYMIGMNAVFGFAVAFLNSYINGEVLAVALKDSESRFVGIFSSWTALVAALVSLMTSFSSTRGSISIVSGILCFSLISFSFLIFPDSTTWNIWGLIVIYTLQGIGRATFESTLKATFATYFAEHSTGAFGNIILQNGLASAIGYILTFRLLCNHPSRYCVRYSDGTFHDVLTFELIVCITGIFAILGYWRGSVLHAEEQMQLAAIPHSEQIEEVGESATLQDGDSDEDH